ncbi:MAG: signal peptidase I [Cellulomonas sp.]
MRIIRTAGNVVLWALAVVGVASVLVWGATALGLIKPLIVVSGSMEPGIMTGDLLIDTQHDTADVAVGEVASLHSDVTGKTVTHRVVSIEQLANGTWLAIMKGDANPSEDAEPYIVGAQAWQPALQLPGWGRAIVTLTKPTVAVPLAVTLLAFLGLTLLPSDSSRSRTDDDEPVLTGSSV